MIGEDIIGTFAALGDVGMLIAITVIIWTDGTAFPTLPEIWMIWIFGTHPSSFTWGFVLVVASSCASLLGNFTLYSLVKLARLPNWVQRRMRQYADFLIVKDEKLLLLNRLAPVVPYTGAFIAACNWNVKKSATYIFLGALAKFSATVMISWLSFDNLREEIAPWVSLAVIAALLGASVVAAVVYKKRSGMKEAISRSQ
ncbi:MAG: hypothetical protein ACUVT7_07985 [Thermoplasmata archaeon]